MKACFFLCCWSICAIGHAQGPSNVAMATYLKAVNYSSRHADVLSHAANEAALAQVNGFSAGVYVERKYLLDGFNQFSASIALPSKSGVFGLQLHQFGNIDFAQSQAGISYGRKLFDKLDVGALFHYNSFRVAGYGNASALNVEAGALLHITDQLHAGIHVANPYAARFGPYKTEKLSSVYSFGFGYDAGDQFFISTEVEKIEGMLLNFNASIHYKVAERLHARGGISSAATLMFLGTGYSFDNMRIDVTASIHQQLGMSPGIAIIFNQKKPRDDNR